MPNTTEYSRLVFKRSSAPGIVPTIPTATTIDNTWLSTDLLVGEGFINLEDDRFWIRTNNKLIEVDLSGQTALKVTTGATLVGNTIYFETPLSPSAYTVDLSSIISTAFTQNYYTTGATLIGTDLIFDRNDLLSAYTADLSALAIDLNTFVTGFTYDNANNFTILNNNAINYSATINQMTGLTINGILSATTYQNLPIDPDNYVTGGTFSAQTLTLDRQNGSVVITGFTDTIFSGGSGSCITDLYVTNIYGCSPITIHDNILDPTSTVGSGTSLIAYGQYNTAINTSDVAFGDNTTADGGGSLSMGVSTNSSGAYSHAQGDTTMSSGGGSHSEGNLTVSSGAYSHAEGFQTISLGDYSHSEGGLTSVNGSYGHSEGYITQAVGFGSHAEGYLTQSPGTSSHSEGELTNSSGTCSHAEGQLTNSGGFYSHAEGYSTVTNDYYAHAEGQLTVANGIGSHAEGDLTMSNGIGSHAEGQLTQSLGDYSHAEGNTSITNGNYSHAEGNQTQTNGIGAHSEGSFTNANNYYSHAEGGFTFADGYYSHSEGSNTSSYGLASHSEGYNTIASGDSSHAEGALTTAIGDYSHAEGSGTTANGIASHTNGIGTISDADYQHVSGMYNETGITMNGAFIVGNGIDNLNRSNLIHAGGTEVNIYGKIIVDEFQMMTGATTGYVLTSDSLGNGTWQPSSGGGTFTGGTVSGATNFTGGISATTMILTTTSGVNQINSNTSTDAFRITQLGTGNTFVVQDSTNPDSSPFVIDNSGNVAIGKTSVTSGTLVDLEVGGKTIGINIGNSNTSFMAGTGIFSYGTGIGINGVGRNDFGTVIGIKGESIYDSSADPSTTYYGGEFISAGLGGRDYSVRLSDGTEGVGKFLYSVDASGSANWTSDLSGTSATISGTLEATTISATTYQNITRKGSFGITIDGGGSAITTGVKGYITIPYNGTITGWNILGDQSGSIVVDVWKDTYANFPPTVGDTIAGTEKPTLTSQQKNQDLSLSSWTTSVSEGDIIAFNVDSATSVTRVNLTINVTKTS